VSKLKCSRSIRSSCDWYSARYSKVDERIDFEGVDEVVESEVDVALMTKFDEGKDGGLDSISFRREASTPPDSTLFLFAFYAVLTYSLAFRNLLPAMFPQIPLIDQPMFICAYYYHFYIEPGLTQPG
jgi:hypothetical protein